LYLGLKLEKTLILSYKPGKI